MKSIKQYILAIAIAPVMWSACNNDLNEIVYSDVTEQSYTYESATAAMGIVYANMRNLFGHTNFYMIQETTSDELVMPANPSGWDDGGIYKRLHLHTWNSENPQLLNMWNALYRGVTNSNRVIAQLESGKVPTPAGVTKESLIAEMKAARAFFYWLICDNFGNAPLVITTTTDLPDKATRKQLYDFIVSELTAAMPSLSAETGKQLYGRFNKWAAKALLANIYLNAQVYTGEAKWQDCLRECNDIISANKYSLEAVYRNVFVTQNENSPEIVFAIPFDENRGGGFFVDMFSWHAALRDKRAMQVTPWGSGAAMGVSQFIDTYDPADKRLTDTWLMGQQFALDGVTPLKGSYDKAGQNLIFTKDLPDGLFTGESEGYRQNKFEVKVGARFDLGNDFPFFRYAQVLMMKAECLMRTGDAGSAAQIVSDVRKRNFSDPAKAVVTAAALTGNTRYRYGYVEKYVMTDRGNTDVVQYGGFMDELGWEFAWEAQRRRDNIRFGIFTKKSWLSHKPQQDGRTVFMIPQAAVNSNPKLQ
ncbi:RagB/SusD family nutrient uptake outer membrane protein [Chitinophaga defluvii]|uniref:RagB/SusD family nutrient uptake outer membrane protein n=1 Tax=Chitinophaga defluvii TaxID=3163343 RepID=A0ABV2T1U8_9BACT